jgi:hypothetical protein
MSKLKTRQYQWRAISPNLMLAKVSRYTDYRETAHVLGQCSTFYTNVYVIDKLHTTEVITHTCTQGAWLCK